MDDEALLAAGIDVSKPSVSRVYDCLLGAEDNYAVARGLGDVFRRSCRAPT